MKNSSEDRGSEDTTFDPCTEYEKFFPVPNKQNQQLLGLIWRRLIFSTQTIVKNTLWNATIRLEKTLIKIVKTAELYAQNARFKIKLNSAISEELVTGKTSR